MILANIMLFDTVLFVGVLVFYGSAYIRAFVFHTKTKINVYNFEGNRDKGFVLLFAVSVINLFFPKYVRYFGNISFLFGSIILYTKLLGAIIMFMSVIFLILAHNSLGDSWRINIDDERKTKLIKSGMYRYTRHPIYFAMTLFSISIFLLLPTILTLIILLGNFFALVSTAKKEEEHLIKEFGDDYRRYMQEVNFLFPKLSSFFT